MLQAIFLLILPSPLKVLWLRRLGHVIGNNVTIGYSVFVGVQKMTLADNVRIGHFNVFKNVPEITLGERATIGRHNVFSTNRVKYTCSTGISPPSLIMGAGSVITNRHYLDIQAAVTLGDFSIISGIGSVIFSHQKGITHLNEAKPIVIGKRVMVGARSMLLPGTTIADYIIVGAGSVVSGNVDQSYSLYAMQKISRVKALDPSIAYFAHEDPLGPGDTE